MDFYLDDLTVKAVNIDLCDLCDDWQWLLNDITEVLIISKMGDMFLRGRDGCIYWLATDSGSLTKIANNISQFDQLLNKEDNLDDWFLPSLIEELIKDGKLLNENQVYSFNKLPVLGGTYELDNIKPTNLSVHFCLTGQIYRQIKDLPDGTKVRVTIGEQGD